MPKDVNIETRETEKKKVQDEKVSTALVKAKPGKIKIKPSSTSTSAIGSSFTVTRPLLTPTTSSVIPSSVVTTPRSPEKKKKPIVLRSNAEKALRDRIKEIGFAKAKKDFVQMYKNTTGEEIKLKSKDALVSRVVDFYETELGDLGKIQEDLNSGDLFTLPSDGPPELEDERESVVMESDDEQEFFDPPSASKTAQDAVLKQIADGDYYTGNGLSTSEINKMMLNQIKTQLESDLSPNQLNLIGRLAIAFQKNISLNVINEDEEREEKKAFEEIMSLLDEVKLVKIDDDDDDD